MLPIVALLSMVGSSLAQAVPLTPQGPQIKLQAVLSTGAVVYVENAVGSEFTTTDSIDNAAIFTADENTGFLYQATTDLADFPSGYAVPAVTTQNLITLLDLTGYDATTVATQAGYYPLSCSGDINLLGLAQLTVPLLCTNTGLPNIITAFGICSTLNNRIVNFGAVGILTYALECGIGAPVM